MLTGTQTLPIVLPFALVCLVVCLLYKRKSKHNGYAVPGPSGGHWIWGHEKEIFLAPAGAKQHRWFELYGMVVRHKGAIGQSDVISVADPRALHHIFTENHTNYTKSPFLRPLIDRLMGRGLVWTEGEQHRQQRKLLTPAFSASSIRSMFPIVSDCASDLRDRLSQYLQLRNGSAIINANEWTSSYTIDNICKIKFDHDAHGGRSPESREILQAWSEQINAGLSNTAFYGLMMLRTFPFISKLPLSYFRAQSRIKDVITRISCSFFLENSRVNEKDRTLMGLLLRKSSDGSTKLTKQDIIDNISTFVIGGLETTAASIQMILYELAKRPDSQDCLRAEIISLGRDPSYDDLMSSDILPYLDAVVKEGLRLHPAGGTTDRVALSDDVISLSQPIITLSGEKLHEIHIKAGQVFHIPMNAINTTGVIWEDGTAFKPERWIEAGGLPPKAKLPVGGWNNLSTFGEGPRMCIGYKLAILEIKAALAVLLPAFIFYDTGVEVETKISTTCQTRVIGKEDEGVQLPLRVEVFDVL